MNLKYVFALHVGFEPLAFTPLKNCFQKRLQALFFYGLSLFVVPSCLASSIVDGNEDDGFKIKIRIGDDIYSYTDVPDDVLETFLRVQAEKRRSEIQEFEKQYPHSSRSIEIDMERFAIAKNTVSQRAAIKDIQQNDNRLKWLFMKLTNKGQYGPEIMAFRVWVFHRGIAQNIHFTSPDGMIMPLYCFSGGNCMSLEGCFDFISETLASKAGFKKEKGYIRALSKKEQLARRVGVSDLPRSELVRLDRLQGREAKQQKQKKYSYQMKKRSQLRYKCQNDLDDYYFALAGYDGDAYFNITSDEEDDYDSDFDS